MNNKTQCAQVALPDTHFNHNDNIFGEDFTRETVDSLAHHVTSAEVDVSVKVQIELIHEVKDPRATLARSQSMLKAVLTTLLVLEQQHPRMERQLDVLIRMRQPPARPVSLAQTHPHFR